MSRVTYVWSRLWRGLLWHYRQQGKNVAICGAKPGRDMVNNGRWAEEQEFKPGVEVCPRCDRVSAKGVGE
jgi:hypothetical protein